MITYPNAKINLGLHVSDTRSDCYHAIETGIYPVPFCDILEIRKSPDGELRLGISGIPVDGAAEDNLCLRAYREVAARYNIAAVHIHLHKQIPTGAGLGGGSADSAFTIRMLDAIFGLSLTDVEMEAIALKVGSDCPFFIKNRPVIATGRGEVMEPLNLNLSGYFLAIAKPSFGISTAEAYSLIEPVKGRISLKEKLSLPVEQWQFAVENDFEKPLMKRYPEIYRIKRELYESGALFAQMTGSGSAVYGIFRKKPELAPFANSVLIYSGLIVKS